MTDTDWAIKSLKPCYKAVFSLRQLVKTLIEDDEDIEINDCMMDKLIVGFEEHLCDPPLRNVFNFRSHSYILADKTTTTQADLDKFLKYQVFDEVEALIGGNRLLHLIQKACWFELIGNKALIQKIGKRLDQAIADPSFVFSTQQPTFIKKDETSLFRFLPTRKKKCKVLKRCQPVDRKCLMYSRAITWTKRKNESEKSSQTTANVIKEIGEIFSFSSFSRLGSDAEFKDIIKKMNVNIDKCKMKSLVDKFCPMKCSPPSKTNGIPLLLQDVQSHENVCELMRSILFFVFPKKLFGSCGNRTKLYRSLKLLITSGLNVQLEVRNLVHGITLSSVPWLSIIPKELQKKTFEELSSWICKYLINSLRCYFYVTETKFDKSKLYFYRKETWNRICQLEIQRQTNEEVLDLLINITPTSKELSLSSARFVPKTDSVRMISSLKKPGIPLKELNGLKSLLCLLKTDKKVGLTHKLLTDVIRDIKEAASCNVDSSVFFIRADIKHCYPSIKHDVLMDIITSRMKTLFSIIPSSFSIQLYNFLDLKSFKMQRKLEFVVIHQNVSSVLPAMKGTLTIPADSFQLTTPLDKIKFYLDRAVIKFGQNMYRMNQGIRQGAILSADLCTLYMESFVNESLNTLDEDHLLLEADDLIILTESRERARSYLNVLLEGSTKYNLALNLDKLRVNFMEPNLQDKNISNEIVFFSHCFNTFKQELTSDYKPYAGKDIQYSFSCNPFISFKKTAKRLTTQLRFLPEFMDRTINCKEVLIRTIFEKVHLQAFRLAAYVLKRKQNKIPYNSIHLHNFIVGIIEKVTRLNIFWSRKRPTEITELDIALTCVYAVRQVWKTERLRSRHFDINQINKMIEHLCSKSEPSKRRELCEIFEDYPMYPFNQIILNS